MDIKEEKKAIKNLKAYLMDEWELTEEQKDEFDELVMRVLKVGREEAKAQAVPEVKLSHCVTLTCAQLREAFMFGAPDEDDQEQLETEMTITWSEEGHSGKGYYCYYSELPEEGAIFLGEVIEAQEQKG